MKLLIKKFFRALIQLLVLSTTTRMRAKLLRAFLIVAASLVCLTAVYIAGYGIGHKAAVRDETKFGIVSYLSLYKLAESDDTNRLQDKLRFFVFASSDYYDRYFSNEVVTNQYFLKDLAEAHTIASIERTQVVTFTPDSLVRQINEDIRTNREPNIAQEPTAK